MIEDGEGEAQTEVEVGVGPKAEGIPGRVSFDTLHFILARTVLRNVSITSRTMRIDTMAKKSKE